MPEPSSDAFLNGQGIAVDLAKIETELTQLWGPAAERFGGPDVENPHVTRIVLANLVVLGRAADAAKLQQVLDTVTERFPCRTIVLSRTDDPGRAVAAEVSALCHLPAPGLPQVCSERIVLFAGPEAADLLPGAVRPLLEANLPFVLWWTDDPRKDEALFRDLANECSRLLLDLPDPGADADALRLGLDLQVCPYGRDVSWFGLTRWRELIAQFFDTCDAQDALKHIDSVRIVTHAPSAEAPTRQAIWLAAWLAGQLGWVPQGRPKRTGGHLEARFKGPSGEVAVTIDTEAVPGLDLPHMGETVLTSKGADGASTFRLRRAKPLSPEVHVKVESPTLCAMPRVIINEVFDSAHRVSAALESPRDDATFRHAWPHALWLLEG